MARLPLEKPISLLSKEEDSVPPVLVGMTDPFLYNPRRLTAGQVERSNISTKARRLTFLTIQGAMLLVQKEAFEVVITLRNPFVFDLELSSLSLR